VDHDADHIFAYLIFFVVEKDFHAVGSVVCDIKQRFLKMFCKNTLRRNSLDLMCSRGPCGEQKEHKGNNGRSA
jgi:hypothetical protein